MIAFVLKYEDITIETEKAYRIQGKGFLEWFPKSQILSLDVSRKTFVIPTWFAVKKGLLEDSEDRLSEIGSLPDWLF